MKRLMAIGTMLLMGPSFVGAAALDRYWSSEELALIQGLSIANLAPLKPDLSNSVSDNPAAALLGETLFSDTGLSGNGAVSCASCHLPDRQFQDDLPVGHGIADGDRRTMPIAGTAYHPFFFWDGRKDSQWSQALGPLENPLEHGADRLMVVLHVAAQYRDSYEEVFGPLPDLANLPKHAAPTGSPEVIANWLALSEGQRRDINQVFSNVGKAISAFERKIGPPTTRFDAYAAALAEGNAALADTLFTEEERRGLKLFIGRANCLPCHAGALMTDSRFHNIGLPGATDSGRSTSVYELQKDPFNCLGEFSDAPSKLACAHLRFMEVDRPELVGAFKSPSLRGVSQRPPFTHTGQFATMRELLVHYNVAPAAAVGKTALLPLRLTDEQLDELEAFLETLNVSEE